jgi:hypothetical protein
LRGALARGEGAAVVHLLGSAPWSEDCLQLAGDGLRVALGQRMAGAEDLAREWDPSSTVHRSVAG